MTVACELHPLPCSSNSRSAYSVAYLHTAILHTQHLFLSIYNYGCLLDKNRTSFPNSGSCMATRQYFLQGPMLVTCQDVPGRSEDEEITAEATQLMLTLQCIARERGGGGKGRRERERVCILCLYPVLNPCSAT